MCRKNKNAGHCERNANGEKPSTEKAAERPEGQNSSTLKMTRNDSSAEMPADNVKRILYPANSEASKRKSKARGILKNASGIPVGGCIKCNPHTCYAVLHTYVDKTILT